MSKIVEVLPLDGYRIWVRFNDGTQGEIDMCPDALYLRLTGKPVDEIFPGLRDSDR